MISDAYGAVRRLLDVIGFNLLFLNIGVQGILLGTVREWSANARKYWFAQHGHLTASEMTLLLAIATSPWAFQGILSLSLPECYTWGRKGYLISLLVALLVAYSVLGSREPQKFSPRVVVLCFFIETLCFVVNWLILDGRISRSIRRFPAQGHALTFFFWFFRRGGTLVGLIASGLSLKLIHSARWSFPLMLIPVTITLGIVISNFVPKTSLRLNSDFELLPTDFDPDDQNNPPSPALPDDEEGAPIRKGLVAPALQCACLATIITILPLLGVSPYVAFLAGVFAGLWVGLAVRNVLGPKLGRINIYYMLARGFNLSISTAVLLCLRDNSHSKTSQDAQKVSPLIYTTTLGVITQVCGILGIVLYAMFMRRWTWRTIFRVPAVLGIVLNACISVILVRRNNRLELSDTWFILGLEAIVSIVDDMNAIPKYHLLPNYCPDGAETAIFAIFASCYHLMVQVSRSGGASLLVALNINPNGEHKHKFSRLWVASGIVAVLHILPLVLIRFYIPQGCPPPAESLRHVASVWVPVNNSVVGNEEIVLRLEDEAGSSQRGSRHVLDVVSSPLQEEEGVGLGRLSFSSAEKS